MPRKAWYAKQLKMAYERRMQMMESDEFYSLEIEESTVPLTAANMMIESNKFDNLEIAIPSTSTTSYPLSRSTMLHRELQGAIQNEDRMNERNGYDDNQKIVESIPSTSSAIHSDSYQSLIQEKKTLKFEIDNIAKVMTCCKTAVNRWLSVLDEEFPEKEYLQEYEEGADKLHELQCIEIELESKQEKIEELEKLRKKAEDAKKKKKISILMIHLPNSQYTTIEVKEGLTLRNAVSKAMERRQLILDDCAAYIKQRMTYFISWDTDISTLPCKEVFVEYLETFPVPVFWTHNFAGTKVVFGYCYVCGKSVLYGFICKACNRKFHTKCVSYASLLCEHIRRRTAYYERLLANNPTTGIIQIPPVPVPSISSRRRIKKPVQVTEPATIDKTTQVTTRTKFLRYPRRNKRHQKSKDQDDSCADDTESEDSIFSQDSIRDFKVVAEEVTYEDDDEKGKGTYGTVYKADWYGPVAVKRLNIEVPTELEIEMFKNEVNVLRKIRHMHVLSFMGCIVKPYLAIITQWCEGNSLYHRLHVAEDELEMITIVIILKQISEVMKSRQPKNNRRDELDEKDEKDERDENDENDEKDEEIERGKKNKKVGTDDKIKKTKRTTTKTKKELEEELENQLAGSVRWMAPEVLRFKEDYPYSFQSDVYAFGIVMYELFARDLPYGYKTDKLFILYNVGRGGLKPDDKKIRVDTPKKLVNLYNQCIEFEKEKRPLFPYILRQVYHVFKTTPKIRRTTSLPLKTDVLADTYIERADDVQDFLTSDADDYDDDKADIDANINANVSVSNSASVIDVFADF
ncbi:PREDICTED: serine/threonine-protein kinase B-raf isoform X2 [Cyphomyrmex costatus]|uniref:serine/threonine-protein kinase B-raf isoform X2 n=1 Tax=Cyphomyrmex costatus TaxID=456900 RepID=UPI0008521DAE|nr:PREDICTED: serine/threonine-protein kinase B-raf isoform X2 [Cyphomyrmex costatus]